MSIWSALGRIWDQEDAGRAQQATDSLSQSLLPGSPYWQSGQLTGDQGVIDGAAQLAANKVGYNPSNMDADTAAIGALGGQFADIAQNGGQLTNAVLDQARSDLANTNVHNLDPASRQQAANVLAQDSAERNWAAAGANKSRAQQLAAQLQKQVWNTAVSHANFQSALAAQGLKNDDRNVAFDLANQVALGAQSASNSQQTLDRKMSELDFKNGMSSAQTIASALSQGMGTIAGMSGAQSAGVSGGLQDGYTSGAQTYDNNYAVPTAALGTQMKTTSTVSHYVNPITGNTVNLNMPTDSSAWGDWLTSGSTLASV